MKAFLSILMICLLLPGLAAANTADGTASVNGDAADAPMSGAVSADSLMAGPSSPATALTAVGSAEIAVQPDIAVLTLNVTDTAASVTDAQSATAATMEALNAQLTSMGIAKEDIATSYYSVNTVYSYQYGKLGEGESPSGYSVKSTVTITLHDVSLVVKVIDAALQSGADNSYELRFKSSQIQSAYDEALAMAAQDAMRKAALLAQATQVSLTDIISLRECGSMAQPELVLKNTDGTLAAGGQSQTLTVRASVEVSYGIEK